jgi:hypothetical protein
LGKGFGVGSDLFRELLLQHVGGCDLVHDFLEFLGLAEELILNQGRVHQPVFRLEAPHCQQWNHELACVVLHHP